MSDLPPGYRWATEHETEAYQVHPERWPQMLVVHLTADVNGTPYTQNEADLALPLKEAW